MLLDEILNLETAVNYADIIGRNFRFTRKDGFIVLDKSITNGTGKVPHINKESKQELDSYIENNIAEVQAWIENYVAIQRLNSLFSPEEQAKIKALKQIPADKLDDALSSIFNIIDKYYDVVVNRDYWKNGPYGSSYEKFDYSPYEGLTIEEQIVQLYGLLQNWDEINYPECGPLGYYDLDIKQDILDILDNEEIADE